MNSITNPQLDFSVIGAVIIFIVLFILAGYLLINNIYSISAMQDIKNYGLLKTIGTTKSQIALLVKIPDIVVTCARNTSWFSYRVFYR